MDVETILARIESPQAWQKRADGWWQQDPALDVRKMAHVLAEAQARLVTITAGELPGGQYRLVYHWDVAGQLFNLATATRDENTPSIADLSPAAEWIEREIHDYFGVRWTGGAEIQPLMLRVGDQPGIFGRNGHGEGAR